MTSPSARGGAVRRRLPISLAGGVAAAKGRPTPPTRPRPPAPPPLAAEKLAQIRSLVTQSAAAKTPFQ